MATPLFHRKSSQRDKAASNIYMFCIFECIFFRLEDPNPRLLERVRAVSAYTADHVDELTFQVCVYMSMCVCVYVCVYMSVCVCVCDYCSCSFLS